jgi:hypothetical protein
VGELDLPVTEVNGPSAVTQHIAMVDHRIGSAFCELDISGETEHDGAHQEVRIMRPTLEKVVPGVGESRHTGATNANNATNIVITRAAGTHSTCTAVAWVFTAAGAAQVASTISQFTTTNFTTCNVAVTGNAINAWQGTFDYADNSVTSRRSVTLNNVDVTIATCQFKGSVKAEFLPAVGATPSRFVFNGTRTLSRIGGTFVACGNWAGISGTFNVRTPDPYDLVLKGA